MIWLLGLSLILVLGIDAILRVYLPSSDTDDTDTSSPDTPEEPIPEEKELYTLDNHSEK